MNFYNLILKPILFRIDPEKAHDLAISLIKNYSNLLNFKHENPTLNRTFCGLKFENPIGLAAGFDKNAELVNQISNLGFGFIEVGTITPKPQSGNPKPRMLRLSSDLSLINSMGFNNDGLDVISKRLESRKPSNLIIGANIGRNKSTPNLSAHHDYVKCFEVLQDLVDYITINVSSPNTPHLKELLSKDLLELLLESIQNSNMKRNNPKPLFLKISPDLSDNDILRILRTCEDYNISGIVSTNTTSRHTYSYGGLSGKLLSHRSKEVSNLVKNNSKLIIISSGGIVDKETAIDRLMNFDLIQLYTGLVYQGPSFTKEILKSI